MPTATDITWFKRNFHQEIGPALTGTPLTLDMLVAIACQETGHVWGRLQRQGMGRQEILALCVGDTIDAPGRDPFPRTKAELIAHPRGQEMFGIARQALVDMARHVPGFDAVAARPNKFCHGFGLFQFDLQFFRTEPDYFLNREYETFGNTLAKCVRELRDGLRELGFENRASITDFEFACVAIVYNTGRFRPSLGLKQGHQGEDGRFYGENIFDFVLLSKTVPTPGAAPLIAPAAGGAILPPEPEPTAAGRFFRVASPDAPLRVRREPVITEPEDLNVIAHLPDGHPVRAVTDRVTNRFREIETSLSGALIRGFCGARLLAPTEAGEIPVVVPAAAPPASGIVAVTMPRRPGSVTRRRDIANAHSLNEPRQPARTGATPAELVASVNAIVDHLAPDEPDHARYRPRSGFTFCNIYAHDVCHLAGAYLPRVWWKETALIRLARGESLEPLLDNTIREMRANDLFRWLGEFGAGFGWRRTVSLDDLQQAANQGGLGLMVARQRNDGRSGHIVVVVPETEGFRAKRGRDGAVTAPLQSQAGAENFRRGTGRRDWWKAADFAESGFWVHA